MNTGKISARYAKALFLFATENKKEDEVYENVKILSNSFKQVPEFSETLENPTISKEKKRELLITAAGTEVCTEFSRFIDLVIEHKREEYFRSICLVFQDMYRKNKNIITSKLITAVPVTPEEEERMRQTVQSVTQGKIEFEKEIDPDILGGFVLNVETYQLDASLKSQLQTIKNDLLSRNAAEA
jgi:F-type H+-transporting ATPase subunit delta